MAHRPRNIFVNRTNPRVTVTVIAPEAELRIGEMKRTVTVYQRGDSIYVRPTQEFQRMFQSHDQENH